MNQGFTLTSSTIFFSLAEIYAFSAKERDTETGLSYFGARYYSSDLSIWLAVDPMSDKYPSLSPYVYCADNPVKLVDPNGEEISSPDGWIVDNTNKTLTWVNNEGGDMFQYVSGKLESFKSKKDFVSEYAAKGYKINSGDATKTLGDATFAAYSGLQKGWNVLSKQQQQKISYDFSKALKNNGCQIQTRQLKLGINRTFSPTVGRGVNALSATYDIANLAYSYQVLDNGRFGVNSYSSLGSSISSWGCSVAGYKFGMSVGIYLGPYGAIIGGMIGGVAGGFIGSEVGSKIGIDAYNHFNR